MSIASINFLAVGTSAIVSTALGFVWFTAPYESDGSWDKTTRRISVNARLFDHFVAAEAPVVVIDGKNLW